MPQDLPPPSRCTTRWESDSRLVLDLSLRRIAPWRRVHDVLQPLATNVTTLVLMSVGVGVLHFLQQLAPFGVLAWGLR